MFLPNRMLQVLRNCLLNSPRFLPTPPKLQRKLKKIKKISKFYIQLRPKNTKDQRMKEYKKYKRL